MRSLRRSAALVPFCWLLAGPAHATGILCVTVEPDSVSADGMLDDWDGIAGRTVGGGSSDAAYTVRCAHDDTRLYLVVDVVDERVLRSGRQPKRTSDDHVALTLRAGDGRPEARLLAFPGVDQIPPVRQGKLAGAQVEDSLQRRGWALEVAVPLRELAGWGPGTPAVYYQIAYHDADLASQAKVQDVLALEGRLVFAAGASAYKAFLAEHKLRPQDLTIDKLIDIDGEPGVERLLAGGRVVGVISAQYSYLVLPVDRPADLLALRLIESTSAGKPYLLAHFRQHGNGGSRELVGVWTVNADGTFARTLAVEVAKQLGASSLRSAWKLEARPAQKARGSGKRRTPPVPAGTDLVVEAGQAVGWDEDSFEETPAEDVTPILTPWGDQQRAVFSL